MIICFFLVFDPRIFEYWMKSTRKIHTKHHSFTILNVCTVVRTIIFKLLVKVWKRIIPYKFCWWKIGKSWNMNLWVVGQSWRSVFSSSFLIHEIIAWCMLKLSYRFQTFGVYTFRSWVPLRRRSYSKSIPKSQYVT